MLAPTRLPGLAVHRIGLDAWPALAAAATPPLGALGYGEGAPLGVCAPLLAGGRPCIDAWSSAAPRHESGRCGSIDWRCDGHWLYGMLALDEAAEGEDFEALARRAYRDIFATLAASPCRELLRLWNYLPRIHADARGLERYRRFNTGRQQAFFEAGRAAFEGAPAACALGTPGGPLRVHFLAGRVKPVTIENPRQVPAWRYPRDYGPTSPSFSRAALFDAGAGRAALLISGTASIVGHRSMHVGDVRAQAREVLANLQALIDAAHARGSARFALDALECIVYVRRAGDLPVVRAVLEDALGADAPALRGAVYMEADVCRTELLVEIEAHAFAPGEVHA